MKTTIFFIFTITLLHSCTARKGADGATTDNDTIISKEELTARKPFSKSVTYMVSNEKGECNMNVTAMFYKNKITTISVSMGNYCTNNAMTETDNDTMAVDYSAANSSDKISFFKIPYKRQMALLKNITDKLNSEYGLVGLRQIFTKTDIWGDASVEVSQEYAKQSSATFGEAIYDAIYSSMLIEDMNFILSNYGLTINSVWTDDKPSFETKKQFLEKNTTSHKHLTDSFISTVFVFELKNK